MQSRYTKIGLGLFTVYLLLYGGFVLLNAFAPEAMEVTLLGGVNLAILYGFGLILSAFLLALLYGYLNRATAAAGEPNKDVPTTSSAKVSGPDKAAAALGDQPSDAPKERAPEGSGDRPQQKPLTSGGEE